MALGEEIFTHRIHAVKTLGLFSCFLVTGLSMGIVGPTLLDLRMRTESRLEVTALIFPVRAAGYAVGSFVSGLLYSKMDVQIAVTVTMALSASLTLAIPFVREIRALLANFLAVGLSLGFFAAGGNMWVLDLWGRAHPPFLQGAHFMLAFGAFAAPLIAQPFLRSDHLAHYFSDHPGHNWSQEADTQSPSPVHTDWPGPGSNSSLGQIMASQIDLRVPFSVIAAISLANSLFFVAMKLLYPELKLHPSRMQNAPAPPAGRQEEASGGKLPKVSLVSYTGSFSTPGSISTCPASDSPGKEDLADPSSPRSRRRQNKESRYISCQQSIDSIDAIDSVDPSGWWSRFNGTKVLVVIMATALMHIYYGLEITFGTFLTTFSHESPLQLAATEGAAVTSVFWATFAFWRLPSIFIVDYFGPIKTVTFNLVILLIGNAVLVPWASSHRWALYSGAALIGLGASPIWASMFSVLELYFAVSPAIATAMITASMMGELVFPTFVSRFVSSSPQVFLWVALFCSSSVILLFASITGLCRHRLGERGRQGTQDAVLDN